MTYDHWIAGIIIGRKVYHELTLKIETGPLFPVEIYLLKFIIIVIIMMTNLSLKTEPLVGTNSLVVIVF